ncbi:uncharacterized protein LOC117169888 [Belonocnema kinseyi]|uniref:uncharacterized protein LOC117169888 n=1 Tax=Belonocnema kinseyi TaxID=2817044 RepID=UPI00143DCDE5|nr:uncharacterized protein LOC117169888 [Belonocnema kinseyi]
MKIFLLVIFAASSVTGLPSKESAIYTNGTSCPGEFFYSECHSCLCLDDGKSARCSYGSCESLRSSCKTEYPRNKGQHGFRNRGKRRNTRRSDESVADPGRTLPSVYGHYIEGSSRFRQCSLFHKLWNGVLDK